MRFAVFVIAAASLFAQRGGNDWMTIGFDAQRSNWLRSDAKISPESLAKPGFAMEWKFKIKNTPRQLHAITSPALLDFFIGHRGFRTLGFFGGSSNSVTGIDTDIARLEWERSLAPAPTAPGTAACPGGMTTPVTRPTGLGYAPLPPAGRPRGTQPVGAVGEPGEGAVTIRRTPPPPPPPPAKPGAAPAFNPFAPRIQWVNAITGDGKFHSMYVSSGETPNPAIDFLPAGAFAKGLAVFNGVAYVATSNGCNGVANGMWALDIASKKVTSWTASANVVGTTGFATGPDGTMYVADGADIVALEPATLKVKATYKGDKAFSTSPVVFEFKGKDYVAAATTDGKLVVLQDGKLAASASVSGVTGALAAWRERSGQHWILAPAAKAIVAIQVVEDGGGIALKQGWTSRELTAPIAPAVVNGVVFAVSTGLGPTIKQSKPAVLYALDGASGKELWSSGSTITSFVTTGGLAAGGSRVYVSSYDGTQYAFGFPIEH